MLTERQIELATTAFQRRRADDPQGVIDDLLAAQTRQADAIHDLRALCADVLAYLTEPVAEEPWTLLQWEIWAAADKTERATLDRRLREQT